METLNPLYQLIISVVVLYATQGVKKIQIIPINDGQKIRIRSFVGIVTFGLTLMTAFLDGKLESVLSPEMIQVGIATGLSWIASHIEYKWWLSK